MPRRGPTVPFPPAEILYEDLHFVAVFLAFLAAVAALLISLMWVCNKCAYKFQRKRRHKLTGNSLGPLISRPHAHGRRGCGASLSPPETTCGPSALSHLYLLCRERNGGNRATGRRVLATAAPTYVPTSQGK